MAYMMFNQHPQMKEVMALRNIDVKMRDCKEKLALSEPLSKGRLNLAAIDICGCYGYLIEYVFLRKRLETPGDKSIYELLDLLLSENEEGSALKDIVLAKIPVVMAWENTQYPLPNIITTIEEVREVFDGLDEFYRWVETTYSPVAQEVIGM
jgi:hypothetical protein